MKFTCVTGLLLFANSVLAAVNPIEIKGRHFFDSVTKEPFFIKGVDYQPGGSAGFVGHYDPLSDPHTCARDIFLFQQLGVNTVRVYSVNPDLNHDECMTMMANAGIYLVLDVNSPKPGQSLNRYEPWTTYNPNYVNHILKVVHQFSSYNNTLAFFAGNEVINDDISAKESPHYLKAIVRDMHVYMKNVAPRVVPVGYSAADDLRFRVSLAKYMECGDEDTAVDFYGVNSYQWCGHQTFETSGFDVLVRDYEDYALPIFLSEYGCNAVMPRLFQEVEALYSEKMTNVFSGGLIYEFAQEPNNYGLVEILEGGVAQLLPDYNTLKVQYNLTHIHYDFAKDKEVVRPAKCKRTYSGLNTMNAIPECPLPEVLQHGVKGVEFGEYVDVKFNETKYVIMTAEEGEIQNKQLKIVNYWRDPMPKENPWKEMHLYSSFKTKAAGDLSSRLSKGSKVKSGIDSRKSVDKGEEKEQKKNVENGGLGLKELQGCLMRNFGVAALATFLMWL